MKRKITLLILVLILGLSLAACGSGKADPTPSLEPTDLPLVGSLTFAGSTTVQPLAGMLAEVYEEKNPEVILEIAAGGSSVGIQAVHDGTADIGMASRNLKEEEEEGINQYRIAIDVIAIIVHPDNPVTNLTLDQLQGIYSGAITNWEQVGGPSQDIVTIIREESSGTRGAFDEIILEGESPSSPNLLTAITAGDVALEVANNLQAIGYIGFGNFEENISVLSIENITPSLETARSGEYPITRPLLMLTGPLSQPLAKDFIDFVLSPEGQIKVQEFGWIPAN